MKAAPARKPTIRIAVLETDPLRLVGLRALLASEVDLELVACTPEEVGTRADIDLALLGTHQPSALALAATLARLRSARTDLRVLVTSGSLDDDSIVKLIAAGAKGYLAQSAAPDEFERAIRVVHSGSIWASRRVLSKFVERAASFQEPNAPTEAFTEREAQVLRMLVGGGSNKEIGAELEIEERTVKAHIAKLMRKVGVENRVALSVFAITHNLVAKR